MLSTACLSTLSYGGGASDEDILRVTSVLGMIRNESLKQRRDAEGWMKHHTAAAYHVISFHGTTYLETRLRHTQRDLHTRCGMHVAEQLQREGHGRKERKSFNGPRAGVKLRQNMHGSDVVARVTQRGHALARSATVALYGNDQHATCSDQQLCRVFDV